MNETKAPQSTKAYRKRSRYIATIITVAILVVIIATSSYLIYSFLNRPPNQTTNSSQPKAAIVDHLSLTAPNPTFNQTATNILKTAGYTVDYHSGEKVTVSFYRNLPTHDYSLLILRVHSTFKGESVVLFTSEPFDPNTHLGDFLQDRVGAVAYSTEDAEKGNIYFGIMPPFVKHSMKGTFNNTVIIMMGCDGLMYTPMAEAFVQKGAKVYISWDGPVSANHTDQATIQLLQSLLQENQTIKMAVEEIDPDPVDESVLRFYPPKAGDYRMPTEAIGLTMKMAETNIHALSEKRRILTH